MILSIHFTLSCRLCVTSCIRLDVVLSVICSKSNQCNFIHTLYERTVKSGGRSCRRNQQQPFDPGIPPHTASCVEKFSFESQIITT